MPTESTYPPFDLPNIDIWALLFERTDRPFPDDKGTELYCSIVASPSR